MSKEINNKIPAHVSLIMDGNGRWAKERGKERVHGHFEGVQSVHACVQAAAKAGVKFLSVFAFSEENWNRPEAEVMTLMGLMIKAMDSYMDEMHKQGVKFVVLGNRERLSEELNGIIDSCMQRTAQNEILTFIIFISYSGKWDILQAAKKMALEMVEHPERKEEILAMGVDGFDNYLVTAVFRIRILSSELQERIVSAIISCGRVPTRSSFLWTHCGLILGRLSLMQLWRPMQNATDVMEK